MSAPMEFTHNDGGREAAGFRGRAGDCVARAVAIASGRPYLDVYDALALINQQDRPRRGKTRAKSARNGIRSRNPAFKAYMRSLGFVWVPTMGIGTGCRVHLAAGELPPGRLVVRVSRHLTAVLDGVLHDTYDPSRGAHRCVYGYWRAD